LAGNYQKKKHSRAGQRAKHLLRRLMGEKVGQRNRLEVGDGESGERKERLDIKREGGSGSGGGKGRIKKMVRRWHDKEVEKSE